MVELLCCDNNTNRSACILTFPCAQSVFEFWVIPVEPLKKKKKKIIRNQSLNINDNPLIKKAGWPSGFESAWPSAPLMRDCMGFTALNSLTQYDCADYLKGLAQQSHSVCRSNCWLIVMCNFRLWWEFMQRFIASSIIMFQFEQCWHVAKIAWVSAGLLFDSCGFKVCMDEPLWASFYPGCVTVSVAMFTCVKLELHCLHWP